MDTKKKVSNSTIKKVQEVKGRKEDIRLIYSVVIHRKMLSFLLPFASKIVSDAVSKIPEDAELGEKLIDLCLVILKKAVKLTKTDMDDKANLSKLRSQSKHVSTEHL